MSVCPALSTGEAFLSTLLRHIDCQAQTIGRTGYQVLADPGSPVALVLTALLTIFIALYGFRMLFGETPTLRDGVMAAVKIGAVLVIATSWPAYRTLAYDVIVQGPEQLSSAIGGPAGLPGANSDLIARLQNADAAIIRLTNLGTGREDPASLRHAGQTDPNAPPPRTSIPDDPAFGWARVLFLSGTVAAFAAVRLTAGILLALGPLFAGLLLFGMARGLFVGWVRALAFSVLASVAVSVVLGVQLALLEPWLAQVLALRNARLVAASAPIELLIMSLAFALALLGSLGILLRLAFTVHVAVPARLASLLAPAPEPRTPFATLSDLQRPERPSSRALVVADALLAAQRREGSDGKKQYSSSPSVQPAAAQASTFGVADEFAIPSFGQDLRRTKPRKSLGAALRDRRS